MRIAVKVIPGSKKSGVFDEGKDITGMTIYKVKTHAKPVDGQANKECMMLLSGYFGVKPYQIRIVQGEHHTHKLVEILLDS